MENFIVYILKVNGLLLFFWLFYRLFLQKETFYKLNRWYFILTILASFLLPLIYFTKTEEIIVNESFLETFTVGSSDSYTPISPILWYENIDWLLISLLFVELISFYKITLRMNKIRKMIISIKNYPPITLTKTYELHLTKILFTLFINGLLELLTLHRQNRV